MSIGEKAFDWVAYTASAVVAGIGVMTWQEWAAAVGIVTAVLTFVVNAWHKRRMVQLREREVRDNAPPAA
jgi:hypothetical protein